MKAALTALALLALLALASCGAGTPVFAHSWYSAFCCDGQDYQPFPTRAVQVTARGYLVTLRPSDHKMLGAEPAPLQYLVPFADAKESPDGGYHACILPYSLTTMRCLYAPGAGS
jgi:hypothetical protein